MSARVKYKQPKSRSSFDSFLACVLLPKENDYFIVELACVVNCTKYESER